jgi:hypothetical protein
MYNESLNSQVIYSLDSLSDSLFKMLNDNDLRDITITRLCNISGISRRTFYRNCDYMLDLISYKIDKLVNDLLSLTDGSVNDDRKHFTIFFNYWNNHKQFLSIIKKQKLFALFIDRFKIQYNKISYHFLEQVISKNKNVKNLKMYFNSYLIGGLLNLLECWVENNFDESIDDLIEIGCSLIPLH